MRAVTYRCGHCPQSTKRVVFNGATYELLCPACEEIFEANKVNEELKDMKKTYIPTARDISEDVPAVEYPPIPQNNMLVAIIILAIHAACLQFVLAGVILYLVFFR